MPGAGSRVVLWYLALTGQIPKKARGNHRESCADHRDNTRTSSSSFKCHTQNNILQAETNLQAADLCPVSTAGLKDTQVPEDSTKEQSAQYPATGEESKEVPHLTTTGIQTNTETPLVKPFTAAAQPKHHGLHPSKN